MICPNCKKTNTNSDKFCGYCGAELIAESQNKAETASTPKGKKKIWVAIIAVVIVAGVVGIGSRMILGADKDEGNVEDPKSATEVTPSQTTAETTIEPTKDAVGVEEKQDYEIKYVCTGGKGYNKDGLLTGWGELSYDEYGNMISRKYYNVDGLLTSWGEYSYDLSGNMISYKYFYTDDSMDNIWYEYAYDSYGNEIESQKYNDDGSLRFRTESTYDTEGNKLVAKNYNENNSFTGWDEYDYNADNNMIKCSHYDEDGSKSSWYEYEYDIYGNIIRMKWYGTYGDWMQGTDYSYDAEGHLINENNYVNEKHYLGGSKNSRNEYSYDANGNVISMERYRDGELFIREEYEYEEIKVQIRDIEKSTPQETAEDSTPSDDMQIQTDEKETDDKQENKKYATIDEYVKSPEVQSKIADQIKDVEASGVEMKLYGDGDKLVYSYQYGETFDAKTLATASDKLKAGLEEKAATFENLASELKRMVDVEDPKVVVKYLNGDGTEIYSHEFRENSQSN